MANNYKMHVCRAVFAALCGLGALSVSASEQVSLGDFTYIIDNGEAGVGRLDDQSLSDIVIPSEITYNGTTYPVTRILQSAFSDTMIESVTFGDNIREIGEGSFYNCGYLASVTFNDGLKIIGEYAFARCGLTEITFPESLERIESEAFEFNAAFWGELQVGPNVNYIAADAFKETINVQRFNVDEANTTYCSQAGVLYSKDMTCLLYLPPLYWPDDDSDFYQLPESVKEIGDYAMNYTNYLTTIHLNEGLLSIGDYAFMDSYISSLEIPSTVTSIGSGVFMSCENLNDLKVAEGNTTYKMLDNYLYYIPSKRCIAYIGEVPSTLTFDAEINEIGDYLFYNSDVESVTLPSTIKIIGEGAFNSCSNLNSVNCEEGLQVIGKQAFAWCSELKAFTFPTSLQTIGEEGFARTGIEEVILPPNLTELGKNAFYTCPALKKVTMPNPVPNWNTGCFYACAALEEASLPEGTTMIPGQTFDFCTSLASAGIPSTVTEIGDAAFYETAITEVTFPEELTKIGQMAFYKSKIKKAEIPDAVTSIGATAFAWCPELETVSVGKGVKTIEEATFHNLPSLKSITLSEGLESIGTLAISHAPQLSEISLPSTVSTIESKAFYAVPFTKIVANMTVPPELTELTFSGANDNPIYNTCTLFVPSESLNAYKDASVWKNFLSITPINSGVGSIETQPVAMEYYSIDGTRLLNPEDGTICIVRMSDGTVRKVIK